MFAHLIFAAYKQLHGEKILTAKISRSTVRVFYFCARCWWTWSDIL